MPAKAPQRSINTSVIFEDRPVKLCINSSPKATRITYIETKIIDKLRFFEICNAKTLAHKPSAKNSAK